MTIVVNPNPPPPFKVVGGRMDFVGDTKDYVDSSTATAQRIFRPLGSLNPLSPVEKGFNPLVPHQDLNPPHAPMIPGQNTGRAHHISDAQIQLMICDYLNNQISLATMLDRIGALYLTSWIDVIITPRLFRIWLEWCEALKQTMAVLVSQFRQRPRSEQALAATQLASLLSNSIANLRIGDQPTDGALGRAIAPRLQRGQRDVLFYFIGWLSGHDFTRPSLSVETSLAAVSWGGHFTGHAFAPDRPWVAVGNVFAGPGGGGQILISEQRPLALANEALVATPQNYPGTQGRGGYVLRGTRATLHIGMVIAILWCLLQLGYVVGELISPKD